MSSPWEVFTSGIGSQGKRELGRESGGLGRGLGFRVKGFRVQGSEFRDACGYLRVCVRVSCGEGGDKD